MKTPSLPERYLTHSTSVPVKFLLGEKANKLAREILRTPSLSTRAMAPFFSLSSHSSRSHTSFSSRSSSWKLAELGLRAALKCLAKLNRKKKVG